MAQEQFPDVRAPWTRTDWGLQVVALAAAAGSVAVLLGSLGSLPERVPVHFNAAGVPDGWGLRSTLVLIVGIQVAVCALLTVVVRFPHVFNYPWPITAANAVQQYALARRLILALNAIVMVFSLALFIGTVRVAAGSATGLGPTPLMGLAASITLCLTWYFIAARRKR